MAIERLDLGVFPTPLQHVTELGDMAGLADLYLKRDDLTGFAWGGNKVRTVEFVLADALGLRADTLIVAGGPTSNFAALLAVAAASHRLPVTQVCYGRERGGAAALAVSIRAGASVEFTGSKDRSSVDAHANALADKHRADGLTPYVVPRGGATPIGACGFAAAAVELVVQLDAAGLTEATVVLPVGSGGSIAGLLAGLSEVGCGHRIGVVGVSVSRPTEDIHPQIAARAIACAGLIGATGPMPSWRLVDGRGTGYGDSSPEADDLTDRVLRNGALVLDPVYNAKALLWLARHRGELDRPVVYWSTGGALASADQLIITTADVLFAGEEACP